MAFIKPRQCDVCREPYTPKPRWVKGVQLWSKTCGKRRCISALSARHGATEAGRAVMLARRAQRKAEKIDAECAAAFGPVSDREREIFAFARALGYDEGYNVATVAARRLVREAGA